MTVEHCFRFCAQSVASFLSFTGVAHFVVRDREISQQLVAYLRLPFQIPLIWWGANIARKTPRE
ncbi:MAG: hypothetical protein EBT42_02410 [Actinobacteria bacterium]|nr:hypothetical protein [Actinomycetota bacterium]